MQGHERFPNRSELREAVLGRSKRLERMSALALLVLSDDPEREALLASVASDPREPPHVQSAAAITLGHVATRKAEMLLVQMLQTAPHHVLPDVLRSLGRIGSPTALRTIDLHITSSAAAIASAAQFAGALIAHRFRLPGHDLPVPSPEQLLAPPEPERRSIDMGLASPEDARAVLTSLAHEPYGIEYAEEKLTQLRCGTDLYTVCLNGQFVNADAAPDLLQRKAVLALVALESREGSGHSISHIVLSRPSAKTAMIELLAPRCTGHPDLAGSARVSASEIAFSLRSVDRPGARAASLDGRIERSQITMSKAIVATRRRPAPRPAYAIRS
jgi:hypothetical protein